MSEVRRQGLGGGKLGADSPSSADPALRRTVMATSRRPVP